MKDHGKEEIKYAGVRMTLTRDDALKLIRLLASYGDSDTDLTIRFHDTFEGLKADFTLGGGFGEMLPVEDIMVRVRQPEEVWA